jgi:hypothetical protein
LPDIFDEVEEDLRAERAKKFWLRYGGLLVGALALVVLGVAGYQGWSWYERRQAEAAAVTYLAIHRAGEAERPDLNALANRFEALSRDAPSGYGTLARLRAAPLKVETGDRAGGLAIYEAVARDDSVDPLYRDYAALMWVLHALDTADPALLATRIAPLAEGDGPWRASARELAALVALRKGDRAAARTQFQQLAADVTAPPGIRGRAQRIAAELGS